MVRGKEADRKQYGDDNPHAYEGAGRPAEKIRGGRGHDRQQAGGENVLSPGQ